MPDDQPSAPARDGAVPRLMMAERRARARRDAAVADLTLARDGRLDDRTLADAALLLDRGVATVARDVREAAARSSGDVFGDIDVPARLAAAGLLRDPGLLAETIAQARTRAIDAGLAATRPPGAATGLVGRLAEAGDRHVRDCARDYLLADNRRLATGEWPEPLYSRIAWWSAAVLRGATADEGALDAPLAAAVATALAARREAGDASGTAWRLAQAIDARVCEREPLLLDTLHAARLDLFVAVLGVAVGIDADETRALALDAQGEGLWLALRAAGLSRAGIARIGWALCEADRDRDVEALADAIDAVDAVTPEDARAALRPLSLEPAFRDAIRDVDGAAA